MTLHNRIRDVLRGKGWASLSEICLWLGNSNRSYVKLTLFAMPDIEWRRVLFNRADLPKNAFYWEFRLVG